MVVGVVRVGEWRLGAGSRRAGTGLLAARKMVNGYQDNRVSGCSAVRRPVELSGQQGIRR